MNNLTALLAAVEWDVGGNIAHMRERWRETGDVSGKSVIKRMCFIAAFWMQCKELDQ